jgi:hypothetical protein
VVGKEGIALMHIAERKRNAALANSALERMNVALMRNGNDESEMSDYRRNLEWAQATVKRLRTR